MGGDYTREQLQQQRDDVENYLKHIYYEPGNDGIYFWARKNRNIKPSLGVVSSYQSDGMSIRSIRLDMPDSGTIVSDKDNKLAWMCYEGVFGGTRDATTPYMSDSAPDMVTALFGATNNYDNGGDFLYHLKQLYIANSSDISSETDFNNKLIQLMQNLMSNGELTADNLREFCWDTSLHNNSGVTASDRVKWSRIGYLTMLIQFAWLAQAVGDTETYPQFETAIWNWVQDGYQLRSMPLLEIEACHEIGLNGTPDAVSDNMQFANLPYTIRTQYTDSGSGAVETLYAGWDAGKTIQQVLEESL